MKIEMRIEQTPWWLTIWGFPPRRRWIVHMFSYGITGHWEYLP